MIGLFVLAACGAAGARTVALWPLEKTAAGNVDARCVIDSTNDLVVVATNAWVADTGAGWSLPPNPDTAPHAWTPFNAAAVKVNIHDKDAANKQTGVFLSNVAGDYVQRDRSFTVEGWIKLYELPASNDWSIVVAGFDDNGNSSQRWTLSFRRRPTENYACTWILWANGGSNDQVLHAYESEEASYAITNTWMHVALVHRPVTATTDNWKLYLDGTLVGEKTQNRYTTDPNGHRLSIGGRGDGKFLPAYLDYWRLSDTCLEPSQFLNAGGGAGTTVANSTVAYWPLGVTANGGVDGRDAVGEAPLAGGNGYNNMTLYRACRSGPCEDAAFTGNPPNPTVTLPDGNAGSIQGAATGASLQCDGAMLNLGQDFTVEGWFAPRTCERATKGLNENSVCYLFGTHIDGKGWNLEYRAYGESNVSFVLYALDQTNNICNNATLSGSYGMANWYETWHHVALTYDVDGGTKGFGRWVLYIDGEQTGAYDNPRTAAPLTDTLSFCLGGRGYRTNLSFQGKMDCARVCTAVLTPEQFLCATNGTAASNVYALWPLNVSVSNGIDLDLRDVSGNNHHFAAQDSMLSVQHVTAVPGEAPTITNPDPTPGFRGDRTKVNGSVRFRQVGGTNQHRSCLTTGSSSVTDVIKGRQSFTLECYYKRESATTQGQENLFVIHHGDGNGNVRVRIFRKSDGLYVWENLSGSLADTLIPGTADSDLAAGTWYHIALVHTMETVEGSERTMWRVYVDGTLKGSASASAKTTVDSWFTAFIIGGRWFMDNNSVNGLLSSVRLSKGALAPADFLCAARQVPAEAGQTVYWPLDASGTGLGSLVETGYPFVAEGTAAAADAKAVASIPNPVVLTNAVTGNARRNAGSVAFGAAGALQTGGAGTILSLTRSFTVEGWVKWTPAAGATADEDLVVAGNPDGHGVRIFFDRSGAAPRLRVKARGLWPCTPWIDTAFAADLTAIEGVWAHVAVVYDATDFAGSWSLFVDGRQMGAKLYNFYYPSSTDAFRVGALRLGSTVRPLAGAVDMWRLTTETLASEQLLYAAPRGAVIFIR